MTSADFMTMAIQAATGNVRNGGGPFGAVIVKDGAVVTTGVNRVTATNDPTAHAEVVAIREACRVLATFDLAGCELYASAEPCPMCLAAIYWSHLDRVYFGASCADAAAADFDDAFIYDELKRAQGDRRVKMVPLMRDEAQAPFREWKKKSDKVPY